MQELLRRFRSPLFLLFELFTDSLVSSSSLAVALLLLLAEAANEPHKGTARDDKDGAAADEALGVGEGAGDLDSVRRCGQV